MSPPTSADPGEAGAAVADPTSDSIVIVGGGFGGLYTALALAEQRRHPPILLIEPNPRFVFLPLLYELLSGELRSWEIAPRYDDLLAGLGVAWLQERVERIDLTERCLHTRSGRRLGWSRLVLACGGESDSFGIPGVDRCTLGFRNLTDVERLHALLAQLRRRQRPLQRLAIVGAGPTGVELACKLADLARARPSAGSRPSWPCCAVTCACAPTPRSSRCIPTGCSCSVVPAVASAPARQRIWRSAA
jgi:NADH dehydrogenase